MEALVYVSEPAAPLRRRDVDAIVATARRVNPGLGLTGMLLWSETRFAQLLEGPCDALDLLYARLLADPRHGGMRLLDRWAATARLFPDWSMGERRLAPREAWALLERLDGAPGAEAAVLILHLMNQVRHATLRGAQAS